MSRDFLLLYVASVQQLLDFVASTDEFPKAGLLNEDTLIIVGVRLLTRWVFVGLDRLQREQKGVKKFNWKCGYEKVLIAHV